MALIKMRVSPLMWERMSHIRPSTRDNFKALLDALKPECWRNGEHQGNDIFGRLDPARPAVTVQGFPQEWRFHGGLMSVGRQVGNAVPPSLAEAIGRVLARQIVR